MVFCGLFPIEQNQFPELRDALEKLTLNDAALQWEPETSDALGLRLPRRVPRPAAHGHRARAARARVRPRPDGDDAVAWRSRSSRPTARCSRSTTRRTTRTRRRSPRSASPSCAASILAPKEYIGQIMELCQEKRGDPPGDALPQRRPRAGDLRPAAGGDRARLLRPAEVAHARLRVAGLRADRPAPVEPGQARRPAGRRPGRRAVDGRAPRQGLRDRQDADREAAPEDPAPAVRRARSRRRSAPRSSRARRSRRTARTSPPSATAATSPASASCSSARRRARSA